MVSQNSQALTQFLEKQAAASVGDLPGPEQLGAVAQGYLRMTDGEQGGLRGAPKFPNPPIFRFLWQDAFRSGEPAGLAALHLMLKRMSQGGIYDHLGGGYARYSTDAEWLVPHFEKMLYDNAQILELLALAHAHQPDPLYAERATETVGWLLRDMTAQAASMGRRRSPPRRTPTARARKAASASGPKPRWTGCWGQRRAGVQARLRRHALGQLGGTHDPAAGDAARFGKPRKRRCLGRGMFCSRHGNSGCGPVGTTRCWLTGTGWRLPPWRVPPRCSGSPRGWSGRNRLSHFIQAQMTAADGRVAHAWRRGRVTASGLIEDQAATARAALALYEASGDATFLAAAERLAGLAQTWFADGHGGFFTTASRRGRRAARSGHAARRMASRPRAAA